MILVRSHLFILFEIVVRGTRYKYIYTYETPVGCGPIVPWDVRPVQPPVQVHHVTVRPGRQAVKIQICTNRGKQLKSTYFINHTL